MPAFEKNAQSASEWRFLMDLLFLGIAVLLFALSWGFVALCERL